MRVFFFSSLCVCVIVRLPHFLMSSKLLNPSPTAVHFLLWSQTCAHRRTLSPRSVALPVPHNSLSLTHTHKHTHTHTHTQWRALFTLLLALKIRAQSPRCSWWYQSPPPPRPLPPTTSSAMSLLRKTPLSTSVDEFSLVFLFRPDASFLSEVDNCPPSNMSCFHGALRKLRPN